MIGVHSCPEYSISVICIGKAENLLKQVRNPVLNTRNFSRVITDVTFELNSLATVLLCRFCKQHKTVSKMSNQNIRILVKESDWKYFDWGKRLLLILHV